ncbi:MAG: flagellar basal body P-ring formation chaperone FlgA, partial [Pirellulales bacterium]
MRLADVAEIVATEDERGRLAALPLMPAPAFGTQRFLQKRELADLLAAQGVDLQEVRFGGAAQVEITAQRDGWKRTESASAPAAATNRHAAILAGEAGGSAMKALDTPRAEELRAELSRVIVDYLKTKGNEPASWRISCDVAERHLRLMDAAISPPLCQGGSPPWTGRQRFVVGFNTPEGAVQVPVYAEVTVASTPVVVAVQPIRRGDVITAAQLELRSVDYLPKATERRAAVDSTEKLIGMEACQAIQAGQVVFSDQVQAPVLVKRGEVITISSHAGGIRVRTTARAREEGARGDLIQVESLET